MRVPPESSPGPTDIVLATLNARWIHASFGLRCLRANLGELRERSAILEFDLQQRPADIVERILAVRPRIVGLGVYVWNAGPSREVVQILKAVAPEVIVVVGGPEVSHEADRQPICDLADHVVQGEADLLFAALCRRLLDGGTMPRLLQAPPPDLQAVCLPYDEYTDQDIARRIVYVEASRGCPFTCEFCLSALDDGVRRFPLEPFLQAMERLLDRGLLHFKFVDRTFNLHLPTVQAILRFFRERLRPGLFLHFELIPDRLPDELRPAIAAFPPGVLQFEVGIQTFDAVVAERIRRRQDPDRVEQNLRWLRAHTGVHVHADLIVGLPGEDLATFARGFDRLVALRPQEIQVGILKRLRGAPIARHDAAWGMTWAAEPPYELLANGALSFAELQAMKRFARFWDLVGNSGNFRDTLELLLEGPSAFAAFQALAAELHRRAGATHGIALPRLVQMVQEHLTGTRGCDPDRVGTLLAADWRRVGRVDWPEGLRPWMQSGDGDRRRLGATAGGRDARQARHRD